MYDPFFFILCRELAHQIADQFRVFGRHIGLKDAVIVGGVGERVGGVDNLVGGVGMLVAI